MSNMRKRYIFDIVLTAVLIFEMFYQLTGNFLHEVVGMAFAACIVLHLVFSRKWFSATKRQIDRKKMTSSNVVRLVLAVLLCVVMVALLVSSLIISNVLYNVTGIDLAGESYASWVVAHTAASYTLCALTVIHLAVHWASAASVFKIPYNHERRQAISVGVGAVAGLGVLLLGINAASATGGSKVSVADAATGATEDKAAGTAGGNSLPSVGAEGPSGKSGLPEAKDDKPFKPGDKSEKSGAPGSSDMSSERQVPDNSDSRNSGSVGGSSDSPSTNGSAPNNSGSTPNAGGSTSNDNSASGNSSSVSGYCTLCRKHCPLSAPQCDEPYLRGLI